MADASPTRGVPALLVLGIVAVAAAAAFAPTISALGSALDPAASTASSTAAILPIAAVLASIAAIGRGGPPAAPKLEPAMLGAVPMLLAGVLLSLYGVARLGFDFWTWHMASVAFACIAVGGLMLGFGVRATTRHGAIIVLLASIPALTLPLLAWIERSATQVMQVTADRLVTAFGLGTTALGDGLYRSDATGEVVAVASACSGLDALALTAVSTGAVLVAHAGRWHWKLAALAVALALVVAGNAMRVLALLLAHGRGWQRAFDMLHAGAGVLLVATVLVVVTLLAPRMQLQLQWVGLRRRRVSYGTRYVVTAGVTFCAALAASAIGLGATGDDQAAARVGEPVQLSRIESTDADDTARSRSRASAAPTFSFDVPGHDVRPDASFPWMRSLFGEESSSGSFTLLAPGRAPVWAQVIVSPSRRAVDQYAPLDCFVAHGSKVVRVLRVELPGGAGMLVDQRLRGHAFSALSWVDRARLPDGSLAWRRVVLLADAPRGDDQRVAAATGRVGRFSFGLMNLLSPAAERGTRGYAHGPAGRRLLDAARSMLTIEQRDVR